MDASLHLSARDFLEAARGFLDRIIARSVVADAACQYFGRVFWKECKDRLPETAWNAKFQFTASDRNLTGIRDLDGILAVLLHPQRELLAFDLLQPRAA